jgi:hypothetical protein
MRLLWRRAAKVWRAKGHSNFSVADALEARFGVGKGLGRSTLATLATTHCEPCPEHVAAFILNELPVLDEDSWGRYLEEEAGTPAEADSGSTAAAEPRRLGEVAREAAAEVAKIVEAWLGTARGELQAFAAQTASTLRAVSGSLDAFASSLNGVLAAFASSVRGKSDAGGTRLELAAIKHRLDQADAARAQDTKQILRAVYGSAGVVVLACVAFSYWQHCVHVSIREEKASVKAEQGVVEKAVSERADPIWPDLPRWEELIEGRIGERKPRGPLMPQAPLKGQGLPPCRGSAEAIRGGCWLRTYFTPPCPPDQFEYGAGCYAPLPAHPGDRIGDPE